MGIPMIVVTLPAMVMLLVPVIVIEGLLCKRWLGLTTLQAIKSNAVSNLASTIIGVPVAWAIMLAVEFGTLGVIGLVGQKQRDSKLAESTRDRDFLSPDFAVALPD